MDPSIRFKASNISEAVDEVAEAVSTEFSKDDNVYISFDYDSEDYELNASVGTYDKESKDIHSMYEVDLSIGDVSSDAVVEMLSGTASEELSEEHALMVNGRLVRRGGSEANAFPYAQITELPEEGYFNKTETTP